MWMKRKFTLWNPGCYYLLTEKKNKEIHVSEVHIFLEKYCYCHSQEILFKDHLKMIYFWEILHFQIQLF